MNINNAILHVFDFVSCVNVFAQVPMDLGNKAAKRYVTSQAKRTLSNLDSKRGTFAENSLFAEEFGANTAVALSRAKAYVAENAEESDEVDARELGREVFADQPRVAERFEAAVEKGALPERVVVEKAVAKRVTKSHKIRTDTGIELTFPAEYGENSDFIEFFSTPDGRIEIALKNIGAIENR